MYTATRAFRTICSSIKKFASVLFVFWMLLNQVDAVRGQSSTELRQHIAALRGLGIESTEEGIAKYFDLLIHVENNLTEAELDDLISQLGSNTFKVREQAVHQLAMMQKPPMEKLKAACHDKDLEVAVRAKSVLSRIEQREDPRSIVFRVIRLQQIPVNPPQLLQVIAGCENNTAFETALDTFAALVGPNDLELVRKGLSDTNVRVKAAAVRALPRVEKDQEVLIATLRDWIEHDDSQVRSAAVRALIQSGEKLDAEKYAKLLDVETMVIVWQTEEKRFRDENKDKRQNREVMQQYQTLLTKYANVLAQSKDVDRATKLASGDLQWIKHGLDTSKHPDVLMYRIRWFNGRWSGWFVPGFNDREKGKGRDIRYWACFNDHEHEVIVAKTKGKYREIQDLP